MDSKSKEKIYTGYHFKTNSSLGAIIYPTNSPTNSRKTVSDIIYLMNGSKEV